MSHDIHPLIRQRKSGRIIDAGRQVEDEKILSMLESARWAPSCANNQPWRIVVTTGTSLEKLKEYLNRGNAWAQRAPLIFVFASKPELDCLITGREYYPLGIGLAIENLLLQGNHLGLVVHPIAGFKEQGVKETLHIPDEYRVHALVVVGHPGNVADMDDKTLEKERQPRVRKALSEFVFYDLWPSDLQE